MATRRTTIDEQDDVNDAIVAGLFEMQARVNDRSLAKVGEKARYTARCGGYFGKPEYMVLLDVHAADGAFVAPAINGNSWKGEASSNGLLFAEGACAGDLLDFAARLVDWREYNDGRASFTFEDMGEAKVTRRPP
jgi:hypothetical protein